jgi:HPt (histidine-containing phosphotransfer) domain-containing protein
MSDLETATLDRSVIATFRHAVPEGAPDLAVMLIDQFLVEAESQADRLRTASRSRDAATLRSAAHNLKGSSLTMGARKLGVLCRAVEANAGREGDSSTLMIDLMTEVDRELINVRAALLVEREGVGPR